jgi:hypothetical protein
MERQIVSLALIGLLILSGCTVIGGDPFGAPPKGTSPNCGPEYRYKFEVMVRSKEEFVEFVRQHGAELVDARGNQRVLLDNFRAIEPGMSYAEMSQAVVDWDKVLEAVVTEEVRGWVIYRLDYEPFICPGQGYTLKMREDGHVSLYGCCGK